MRTPSGTYYGRGGYVTLLSGMREGTIKYYEGAQGPLE